MQIIFAYCRTLRSCFEIFQICCTRKCYSDISGNPFPEKQFLFTFVYASFTSWWSLWQAAILYEDRSEICTLGRKIRDFHGSNPELGLCIPHLRRFFSNDLCPHISQGHFAKPVLAHVLLSQYITYAYHIYFKRSTVQDVSQSIFCSVCELNAWRKYSGICFRWVNYFRKR